MNNKMWRLHFFLLAVVVLIGDWTVVAQLPNNATTAATNNSSNNDNDTCYTNFRDLSAALAIKPPFEFRTYIVCANTTINVGDETFFGSNIYINGDVAMKLRQYTKIYCGRTGSSQNNCTVRGGTGSQIYVRSGGGQNDDADDKKRRMVISGFTFEDAGRAAVSVVYPGAELILIDCIFRHCHHGVLTATAPPPSDGIVEMTVTFRNCTFRDNNVVVTTTINNDNNSGNHHHGRLLFDVQDGGVHLTIQDSVLVNNTFFVVASSSPPLLIDAPTDRTGLTLLNNCFYDRRGFLLDDDHGAAGPVTRVYSTASLRNVSHNYHGPLQDNNDKKDDKNDGPPSRPPQPIHCPFIQVQQKPPPDFHFPPLEVVSKTTAANYWCVDFDLDECPLAHGGVVAAAGVATTTDESPPFSSFSSSTRPWSSATSMVVGLVVVAMVVAQHLSWWWDQLVL
jgi:hypothetical protein